MHGVESQLRQVTRLLRRNRMPRTEHMIDWGKTAGEIDAEFTAMAEKCGAVRDARDALREATKVRCTCSGFVIQYEGGCVCERGKARSAAKGRLTQAIDAL